MHGKVEIPHIADVIGGCSTPTVKLLVSQDECVLLVSVDTCGTKFASSSFIRVVLKASHYLL